MFEHSATINHDDGWIRFEPGYRLDKEEYAAVTKAGLNWKRAEQCFVAPWTPTIEDFLRKEFAVSLEPDNTNLLAVARGRAQYYQQYRDNAAARSNQARQSSDQISQRFAGGQPILVGHHSEKGARRDHARMWNQMGKAIEEGEKAEKWDDRAQSTLSRAAARYEPLALTRRIEKLQAELRSHQKPLQQIADIEAVRAKNPGLGDELSERIFYAVLTTEKIDAIRVIHERWVAFLQARIEVAQALYEESGGVAHDQGKLMLEVGGAVKYGSHWYPIARVNQKTVTTNHWMGFMAYKLPLAELTASMTKEEWEQADKVMQSGVGYRLREKKHDDQIQN
jgi:hypothetical protein